MNTPSAVNTLASNLKSTAYAVKDEAEKDLKSLSHEFATLQKDFSVLLKHVKESAGDTAALTIAGLSDNAHRVYDTLAEQTTKSSKAVSKQVEANPLTALLIAFGVGFIAGKALNR